MTSSLAWSGYEWNPFVQQYHGCCRHVVVGAERSEAPPYSALLVHHALPERIVVS